MNLFLNILLVLAGIILLLLVIGLSMRKNHFVQREIVIQAPRQKVFDFIKYIKNEELFNEHAKAGGERKKKHQGTDGTVGYIYSWSGDKDAGVGEKEIINMEEGKSVETEIRFIKPMTATARIKMELEPVAENQTKLFWSNAGKLNYPLNILIPTMEKSVARSMDKSLITLKEILET